MASLQKNVATQNITFVLVNASTGAALTGATVTVYVTVDRGVQATGVGSILELGHGQYNYQPAQSETNGIDCGFLFTATGAIPVNADFHTDPTNFPSMSISGAGMVGVTSNFKRGSPLNGLPFVLTDSVVHGPKTGATSLTSFISKDAAAPVATANAPSEVGNGGYAINLTAGEMTATTVQLFLSAAGCDVSFVSFVTQP